MDRSVALNNKIQRLKIRGVVIKPPGTGLPTYPAGNNARTALFNRQRRGQAGG